MTLDIFGAVTDWRKGIPYEDCDGVFSQTIITRGWYAYVVFPDILLRGATANGAFARARSFAPELYAGDVEL